MATEAMNERARDFVSDKVWNVIYELRTIQEEYTSHHDEGEPCALIAAALFGMEWGYKEE